MGLKELIRETGLKQSYLAEKIGAPQRALTDICAGRRELKSCEALILAPLLRITTEELIKLVENEKESLSG